MKKYILAVTLFGMLVFPDVSLAKKVTCNNSDYNATVEIDKEKLNINEEMTINITSDYKYNVTYKINDNKLASITDNTIKAIDEGTAVLNVEISFNEPEDESSCSVNLPIEIVSNDSTLKSLTLEELDISALFQTDKYEYEINLPYKFEKINILAEASNKNAKITGDGRRYLNEGINEYEVVVTATDGTTSTYKIIINREEANDDVTLETLVVEGYVLSPKFHKDTYKYSLSVDKDVNEITINAKPTYEFAKIRGTGTYSLATGKNTYYVVVTAESGNELKYEIEILKNKGSSKLKNLVIEGYDLKFNSDVYSYNLTVNNSVKKIDIKTETLDNDQVEVIGDDNLKIGKNEIIIRVTGEDKSTTTYKLIINRLTIEEEEKIEKNNILLKALLIIFIISIVVMFTLIGIFLKRNYKRKHFRKINKSKRKK